MLLGFATLIVGLISPAFASDESRSFAPLAAGAAAV
jgi:hypothetical protein